MNKFFKNYLNLIYFWFKKKKTVYIYIFGSLLLVLLLYRFIFKYSFLGVIFRKAKKNGLKIFWKLY